MPAVADKDSPESDRNRIFALSTMYSKEEIKILRKNFWDTFGKRCEIVPELRHRKKKWMLHRTRIPNVALKFEVGRTDAKVMIEISHRSENRRIFVFETLQKYRLLLEEGFENGLEWEFLYEREESGQEVCRIYTSLPGADFHRQHTWPDIYNFFIENMLKLERNFLEIHDVLQEEIRSYDAF